MGLIEKMQIIIAALHGSTLSFALNTFQLDANMVLYAVISGIIKAWVKGCFEAVAHWIASSLSV